MSQFVKKQDHIVDSVVLSIKQEAEATNDKMESMVEVLNKVLSIFQTVMPEAFQKVLQNHFRGFHSSDIYHTFPMTVNRCGLDEDAHGDDRGTYQGDSHGEGGLQEGRPDGAVQDAD